jgi:hypothetical protein
MHFDTRLFFVVLYLTISSCSSRFHTDEQSYLSLIEFHRGSETSNLILASPHGGFLGANFTLTHSQQELTETYSSTALSPLPIGGCYNNTLDRCVYTFRDCLRADRDEAEQLSFHADARCMLDRSSTATMYSLTNAISQAFPAGNRPYTILNRLTRQYVDPAEDLLLGTFLLESATRTYVDYHRLIAMAKEATRPAPRGLFIEFIFHRNSQTVQLGYGFDATRSSTMSKPTHSTILELIGRSGPSVIRGDHSFGHCLRANGFEHVLPLDNQQRALKYRLATHSTRTHADQRFNAILFSYPIERLRTRSVKLEAARIAKAIEQFLRINHIQALSSSSRSSIDGCLILCSVALLSTIAFDNNR